MVPPEHFAFNPQTAESNAYQKPSDQVDVKEQAMKEFKGMVEALKAHDLQVIELHQNKTLPDAVFPNNWFSTHLNDEGEMSVILYPMFTENRQQEVVPDLLIECLKAHHIELSQVKDFRLNKTAALEGTGSVILDRAARILYAALSPRTDKAMVERLARELRYEAVIFNSVDQQQQPIYHSNVMMSVARHYAIVCLESIVDGRERQMVIDHLETSNKKIIPINYSQLGHMCGNALELRNSQGDDLLVMSRQAFNHFNADQLKMIEPYAKILPVELETIEAVGGGSARCMMAEIFYQ